MLNGFMSALHRPTGLEQALQIDQRWGATLALLYRSQATAVVVLQTQSAHATEIIYRAEVIQRIDRLQTGVGLT